MSIRDCLTSTTVLASAAALLSAAELLALLVQTRNSRPLSRRIFAAAATAALAIAAAAAGAIATAAKTDLRFLPVSVLALGALWFARAARFGREGSDDILLIVLVGLAGASVPGAPEVLTRIWLSFIAAQLMLAYFVSGAAKLLGDKWLRGEAVGQVLSTREYGLGRAGLYETRHVVLILATWATIAFEVTLPALFVLGGPLLWPAVAIGISFHLGVALTMGLNRFVISFIAAYPSVIWASSSYGLLS
ncbi:MAG TPA: hypothetical protein VF587_16735 [Solirubrobacteraceae bacterium]|jgi:hypothetical protein